jgi:hypothetical protein
MQRLRILFAVLLTSMAAKAAEGRVYKVLPCLVDTRGRQSLAPSLFERDAYQSHLRKHPELVGGHRFDVHWKAARSKNVRHLQLELRTSGRQPTDPVVVSQSVAQGSHGGWTRISVDSKSLEGAGEILAWHVVLFDGETAIADQSSFLW